MGSPERLVYEGLSTADYPIALRERPIIIYEGGVLDVEGISLPTRIAKAPQELYEQRVAEAESDEAFIARKAATRAKWLTEYVGKRVAEGASEAQARHEVEHIDRQTLLGSFTWTIREGRQVTIGEILFNSEEWVGEVGPDPVEPNSRELSKARIMEPDAAGRMAIFSYKHGGTVYRLKHDADSIAAGFVTRFKVPDKDAYEAFLFAMTLSADAIGKTERTDLIRKAAAHFGYRPNDIRGEIGLRSKFEKIARAERRVRSERRALIMHNPAKHAQTVETVTKFYSAHQPPLIFDHGGHLSVISSVPTKSLTRRQDGRNHCGGAGRLRSFPIHTRVLFSAATSPSAQAHRDGPPVDSAPPRNVVEGFMTNDLMTLPPLYAIRSIPPISLSGEIIRTAAGYATGIYYDGTCGTIVVPDEPSLTDAQAAWAFIYDIVLCEFVFDSEVDKATALAMVLTLTTRHDYDTAPAFIIDAPAPATGKGRLAKALILVATGTDAPGENFDNDNVPEIRKVLTTEFPGRRTGDAVRQRCVGDR